MSVLSEIKQHGCQTNLSSNVHIIFTWYQCHWIYIPVTKEHHLQVKHACLYVSYIRERNMYLFIYDCRY